MGRARPPAVSQNRTVPTVCYTRRCPQPRPRAGTRAWGSVQGLMRTLAHAGPSAARRAASTETGVHRRMGASQLLFAIAVTACCSDVSRRWRCRVRPARARRVARPAALREGQSLGRARPNISQPLALRRSRPERGSHYALYTRPCPLRLPGLAACAPGLQGSGLRATNPACCWLPARAPPRGVPGGTAGRAVKTRRSVTSCGTPCPRDYPETGAKPYCCSRRGTAAVH